LKKIHVIAFDQPLPANYGGVIDVMQHLKMLKQLHYEVILHCFSNEAEHPELSLWCNELYLYPRNIGILKQFSILPYIVNTRKSDVLLDRLLKDDFPILFEGIHSCALLSNSKLSARKKIVRTHNVEALYYRALANTSHSIVQKIYFNIEAWRLSIFEKKVKYATHVLAVSDNDVAFFKTLNKQVILLQNTVELSDFEHERTAKKTDIVFHGNLSVAENSIAAKWIGENVAIHLQRKVIICGKNPTQATIDFLEIRNCEVFSSPTNEQLSQILGSAKIHLLPTFQATGAKNKNLRALSAGGFCLVNKAMMEGTNLHEFVVFAETPDEFLAQINILLSTEYFPEKMVQLEDKIDTKAGATVLKTILG
jgi:hypothetical protein